MWFCFVLFIKVSARVLQGFLDIMNALECRLTAHIVRTSDTFVCGAIDASLFVSCGTFDCHA